MEKYPYFENMDCTINLGKVAVNISQMLILLLTLDLTFPVDNMSAVEVCRFCCILNFHGLSEHVNKSIHKGGPHPGFGLEYQAPSQTENIRT